MADPRAPVTPEIQADAPEIQADAPAVQSPAVQAMRWRVVVVKTVIGRITQPTPHPIRSAFVVVVVVVVVVGAGDGVVVVEPAGRHPDTCGPHRTIVVVTTGVEVVVVVDKGMTTTVIATGSVVGGSVDGGTVCDSVVGGSVLGVTAWVVDGAIVVGLRRGRVVVVTRGRTVVVGRGLDVAGVDRVVVAAIGGTAAGARVEGLEVVVVDVVDDVVVVAGLVVGEPVVAGRVVAGLVVGSPEGVVLAGTDDAGVPSPRRASPTPAPRSNTAARIAATARHGRRRRPFGNPSDLQWHDGNGNDDDDGNDDDGPPGIGDRSAASIAERTATRSVAGGAAGIALATIIEGDTSILRRRAHVAQSCA